MPLKKAWIDLFSSVWVNWSGNWALAFVRATVREKENSEFKSLAAYFTMMKLEYPRRFDIVFNLDLRVPDTELYSTLLLCSWCYGYCPRKLNQQLEFETWSRLFTFHTALIHLRKVWRNYSSPNYRYIVEQTGIFYLDVAIGLGEGKF